MEQELKTPKFSSKRKRAIKRYENVWGKKNVDNPTLINKES